MDEKKHGLYKVADQADRMARLVMDQLAKDGCANLENIRNALMAPLVSAELDHRADLETRQSPGKWLPGHPRPADDFAVDLRLAPGADHMENRGSMHIKCRCPKCRELAERGKAWRDQYDAYVHKVAARQAAAKSDTWHKFRESLGPLQPEHVEQTGKSDAADAMRYAMGVDPAAWSGVDADGNGCIKLWEMRRSPNGHEDRRSIQATRPLLKALGDAIATKRPQRVSISDGTYILPDGEVLTELEMIKRSGTDGRARS
jgi:phage FluMu protein Com